jgi:hypothetical protein
MITAMHSVQNASSPRVEVIDSTTKAASDDVRTFHCQSDLG